VLAGIRVLDVTTNISGPSATMILAALGADVIKIERPGTGDDARRMAPISQQGAAYFIAINRGKRSVALDLSRPEGVATALRLASTCDVFIENFRGGKAEAMGLGESAIRGVRDGIVYASLSAFGPRGPDFEKPGYDALVQARTGIQSVTGEAGTAGARAGVSILDMGTGMWMALGIVAGLFDRARTGRGTRVDGSLYQTGVMWMAYHLIARQMTGVDPQPQGTRHSAFAPYGDFATADSRILIGISNDRLFERLSEAVGLAREARFSTNAGRVEHRDALDALLASIFAQRTTAEWIAILDRAGVPASAIQSAGDLLRDPQLASLGQMSEAMHGLLAPDLPLEFAERLPSPGAPPRLGEHTRAVLAEAGFDDCEIESLIERRIIECPQSPKPKNSA
jgi:crotonobetainyl-CoA:carnitine CoA-transferase CaiB-like acyl-CoA transferase